MQERVRAGAIDLQTVARLFGFYAYEGNYEQAASLLRELEARRGGGAAQPQTGQPAPVGAASWNARELEQVAGMLTSIGYYDQASRYLYTLYLVGGLQSGSKAREDALYRLFKVMIDASGTPTRVATGDLSFYKDVAEVDQHPGFMNGVLSLILSGSDIAQEFAIAREIRCRLFQSRVRLSHLHIVQTGIRSIELPGRYVSGNHQRLCDAR